MDLQSHIGITTQRTRVGSSSYCTSIYGTAVKNLYLSKEFTKHHVATALQKLVVGGTTQALPNLQNLSRPVQKGIDSELLSLLTASSNYPVEKDTN